MIDASNGILSGAITLTPVDWLFPNRLLRGFDPKASARMQAYTEALAARALDLPALAKALYWHSRIDYIFDPEHYHVHHCAPLFLGGIDNLQTNGIYLPKQQHLDGHDILRYQPQFLAPANRDRPAERILR